MKIITPFAGASLALLALIGSGCGEPPQTMDAPSAASPHGAMQLSGEEARVAGTILLEGAQFDAPTGTLFANVRLKGQKAPWLSRMYPLTNAPLATSATGAKILPFELRSRDPNGQTFNLNGQHVAPSECEVYICYKPDRFVESETLADALARFESGKTDYELTLKLP